MSVYLLNGRSSGAPNGAPLANPSPRRSLLDLAPLELDCMNTLWPMGEATVREIRDRLAERRPRAYTTIMTIMDRLARKGVVERRKSGRAYVYKPHLSAQEARAQAVAQIIENYFAGAKEALIAHLGVASPARRADGKSFAAIEIVVPAATGSGIASESRDETTAGARKERLL